MKIGFVFKATSRSREGFAGAARTLLCARLQDGGAGVLALPGGCLIAWGHLDTATDRERSWRATAPMEMENPDQYNAVFVSNVLRAGDGSRSVPFEGFCALVVVSRYALIASRHQTAVADGGWQC
jgi:hypothetical protein